jgi:hypothetical protein
MILLVLSCSENSTLGNFLPSGSYSLLAPSFWCSLSFGGGGINMCLKIYIQLSFISSILSNVEFLHGLSFNAQEAFLINIESIIFLWAKCNI